MTFCEKMQLLVLLYATAVIFSASNCSCKDPEDSQYSGVCYEILQGLQNALTQDRSNLYRSRKAFFYAPNADPVLLKVKYNITFAENITEDMATNYCTNKDNNSSVTLNQTEIIHGWTSKGLYLWIEPLFLNHIQMMLPFIILRGIHQLGYFNKGNPEMDTFLWGGDYDLPTLRINLNITSLPCIPSEEIFTSAIEELTTFLKVYASQGSISDIQFSNENVGFALSEKNISALSKNYAVTLCLFLYDTIGYIILITAVVILSWIALTKYKTNFPSYHDNLLISTVIIGSILTTSECIARCIVLPKNDDYPKYLLNDFVWIFASFTYIFFFIIYCISKQIGTMFVTLHIAILFMLIYHYSLPAFLLSLVYPTKVIIVMIYLITFVFVAIILCSISLMMWRTMCVVLKHKSICVKVSIQLMHSLYVLSSPVTITLLLVVLFQLVYALMLNQPSSAGPAYTLLSLIPSAALSFISWLLKTKVYQFDFAKHLQTAQSTVDTDEQTDTNDTSDMGSKAELMPLLKVDENYDSESYLDHSSGQDYGATKNEEKNMR